MPQDHEHFMRLALEEAAKAGAEGNSAVGSVVVRDGAVVAGGRNLGATTQDPTAHAETVALREARAAQGHGDLSGCVLYTTFQPCPMCLGALMVSEISMLVMGAQPDPSVSRFADYTVEGLLELSKWGDRLTVVAGVLTQEGFDIRREWEARR